MHAAICVGRFLDTLGKVLSSRKCAYTLLHIISHARIITRVRAAAREFARSSKSLHFGARSSTSSRRFRFDSTRRIPTRFFEKVPRKRAHSNAYRALPHWRHTCMSVFTAAGNFFLRLFASISPLRFAGRFSDPRSLAKHQIFCSTGPLSGLKYFLW